jgi:hypothetical protein
MRMKARKTFLGKEGMILIGQEFDTKTERRAQELERMGHAVPVPLNQPREELKTTARAEATKAEKRGPLSSRGGAAGVAKAQPSSPRVRRRRTVRTKSKGSAEQ